MLASPDRRASPRAHTPRHGHLARCATHKRHGAAAAPAPRHAAHPAPIPTLRARVRHPSHSRACTLGAAPQTPPTRC
eukprot:6550913-Prymnesium_polylepis.2